MRVFAVIIFGAPTKGLIENPCPLLGGSGDLVSLLSNGSYRAYYGLLWWLIGRY